MFSGRTSGQKWVHLSPFPPKTLALNNVVQIKKQTQRKKTVGEEVANTENIFKFWEHGLEMR